MIQRIVQEEEASLQASRRGGFSTTLSTRLRFFDLGKNINNWYNNASGKVDVELMCSTDNHANC